MKQLTILVFIGVIALTQGHLSAYGLINSSDPLVKWPTREIAYYVNPQGSGLAVEQLVPAIQAAFGSWAEVSGLHFTYLGATSAKRNASDGQNVIYWDEDGSFVGTDLGRSSVRNNSAGEIIDVDIAFNGTVGPNYVVVPDECRSLSFPIAFNPKGLTLIWNVGQQGFEGIPGFNTFRADVQATATHEIGHLLGLIHTDTLGAAMSTVNETPSIYCTTTQAILKDDDIAGVRFLYNRVPTAGFTMTADGVPSRTNGEVLIVTVTAGGAAIVDTVATDCSPGPALGCSYDPDGHIVSRSWTLDGKPLNVLGDTLLLEFMLGIHDVSLIVSDDHGAHSSAVHGTIDVRAINERPTAHDDFYTMTQGTALTVPAPGVLQNDTVPNGTSANVEFLPPFPPGRLVNLNNGSGGFIYTPNPSFNGTVSFSYLFHTTVGDSNVAIVTVTVNPLTQGCPINAKALDVPLAIPPLGQASSQITIPADAGAIVDANLIFRFTNTCDTLTMDLRAPDGRTITVKNAGGACFGAPRQGLSINPLITQFLTGHPASGTWTLSTRNVGAEFSGTLDSWSLTLQVTGAAGRCSSLDDSFDGTSINSGLWAVQDPPAVGAQGRVDQVNQQLEITNSAPGPSRAGIASRSSLTGDFDVQVDYRLLDWPASSGHSVELRALDLQPNPQERTTISRHSSRVNGEQLIGAFTGSIVSIPTIGDHGKLRFVRTGNALGAFGHDGSRWVSVLVTGASSNATRISLEAGSTDASSPGNVRIAFDNFQVNQGASAAPAFDFALDFLHVDGNVLGSGNPDGTSDFADEFDDNSLTVLPTAAISCRNAPVTEAGGFLHLSTSDGTSIGPPFELDHCFLGDPPGSAYRLHDGAGDTVISASFRADVPVPATGYGLQAFTADNSGELVNIQTTNGNAGPALVALVQPPFGVRGTTSIGVNLAGVDRLILKLVFTDATNRAAAFYSVDNGLTFNQLGPSGTLMTNGQDAIVSFFGFAVIPP